MNIHTYVIFFVFNRGSLLWFRIVLNSLCSGGCPQTCICQVILLVVEQFDIQQLPSLKRNIQNYQNKTNPVCMIL